MPLPKELTTITPLSKGLALSMFVFIPFIAFIVGVNYGEGIIMDQMNKASLSPGFAFPSPTKSSSNPVWTPVPTSANPNYSFLTLSGNQTIFISKDKKSIGIISNDLSEKSKKIIYSLSDKALEFDGVIHTNNTYGIAEYFGGDANNILIFTLNGQIVSDNVSRLNPELAGWMISFDGKKMNNTTATFQLGKISTETASVDINLSTGKVVPGTFIKH